MQALAPQPLADARLPEAIQDIVRRWEGMHGVTVSFMTTGKPRVLRPEIEVALLRTAQEALANVAKHAHAGRVGLTLSYMEDLITLDVRDDGVGFATVNGTGPSRPRDAEGGFGLAAMRQRVQGIAGTLEVESEPNAGTAISAAIPAVGDRRHAMSAPIRVMIVDDHPVVRNGLSGMFAGEREFDVVAEAADGSEAVRRARALSPDVILMDLRMPGMDGVRAIAALTAAGVPARVLVLTTYDTDSEVLAAIEAGATGYLLKDTPPNDLFRAVRAAARAETVLSPTVATRVVGQMRGPTQEPISQRELEVLELIAQGASNRSAAARLFISEATVKTHLMHIYDKLGVNDRAAAVAEAFNRGLLIPRHER